MKTAIGLMSGTSMDGIDAALIRTDGEGALERLAFAGISYEAAFRRKLAHALDTAKAIRTRDDRPGDLADIERELTLRHAEAVEKLIAKAGIGRDTVDVIGFHGQTVLHRPHEGLTVQLGDGPLLARTTGLPAIYDMRANDMAHGGEGAPLVPAYHAVLAANLPEEMAALTPAVFANIGGISNITYVGRDGRLIAFDSGPGNTLIDQWVERHAGIPFDQGGAIASEGRVVTGLAERYLASEFFLGDHRRSLDRNDFQPPEDHEASLEDGARTLAHVTAAAILKASDHLPEKPKLWIVAGGGRLNRAIMEDMAALAGEQARVVSAEQAGFDGDAMEAEAWAYLAVRSVKGLPLTWPETTHVREAVSGGVLASPPVVETERLALVPWETGDAALLCALHGTEESARHVGDGQVWTLAYAQDRMDEWMAEFRRHGISKLKLLDKETGAFIGRAGFCHLADRDVFEIGYGILPSEWGKGYASEIATGLARWFFATYGDRDRFIGYLYAANPASGRVLEKIGMRETEPGTMFGAPFRFFEMRRDELPG